MLPINTHSPARDTVKPEHISSNSHQGSESATDENYQDVLSSLEQEHATGDNGQANESDQQARQTLTAENGTSAEQSLSETTDIPALQEQAEVPLPELLADEAARSTQENIQAGQLTANPEAGKHTVSPANAATSKPGSGDVMPLSATPAEVKQTAEQVATYQPRGTTETSMPSRQTGSGQMLTAEAEQLTQAAIEEATITAPVPPASDTGKHAEQASRASSQAVSLVYRQQELQGAYKLPGERTQALTGQSGIQASSSLQLNKTDALANSVLHHQVTGDIKNIIDVSGAKVPAEGQGQTTSQSQVQTLAMDAALAERSQTANGKYEWSMLKLDSQKQNWSRQLFNTLQDRIEMQVNQQIKQAKIRLDPPELGRLELMVRIEGDRMSVSVNASNAGVRDALQETNERLRQELENQFGSSVDVNVGSDSSGQEFKNEEELVAVSNVEATEINPTSVPLTTGWLNALA
ncbi:flagellar hook-length control protein FliK [Thalassomonas viridans]|uniref:Flagellar hook-length control protein FliK n=1 Tax=Thalassomonas viridans TaxID=137584 RepID=A0AAF0C980_9GAMM|nr:flagellar hook-length control protein FliK [Thalassomonas viridans]WDE05191.1 flagellar hook-length control protein FliK [Thalassomonas viridans]